MEWRQAIEYNKYVLTTQHQMLTIRANTITKLIYNNNNLAYNKYY